MTDSIEKRKLKIETRLEIVTIVVSVITMVVTPISSALVVKYQLLKEFNNWLQEKRFEREEKRFDAKAACLKDLVKDAESFRAVLIRYEETRTDIQILAIEEARERQLGDDQAANETHTLATQIEKVADSMISQGQQASTTLAVSLECSRLFLPKEPLDELGARMKGVPKKQDIIIPLDEIKASFLGCNDSKATNDLYFALRRSYPERHAKQGYSLEVKDLLDALSTEVYR